MIFNADDAAGSMVLAENPGARIESVAGASYLMLADDRDPYARQSVSFHLDSAFQQDVVVEITFLDQGAGVIECTVGKWKQTDAASYTRLNTGQIRSAWFAFASPKSGETADTLSIQGIQYVQSIRLHPPLKDSAWAEIRAKIPRHVTPMVTLQRPMDLVTSAGVDVKGGVNTLEQSLEAMTELAPLARVLGFTAVESYVTWKRLEPAEGQFDFEFYDTIVAKLAEYDLKWFPLLIVGSAYALPDWFAISAENEGFICLEHGIENPIQSIWSPYHKRHVTRVLQAFGQHYEPMHVLQGVRLGPSGNYGESQYPAGGNWAREGEEMHIHIGFWAGDPYALENFRATMAARYGAIADLNTAWGSAYGSFDEVPVVLPQLIGNPRQRIDTASWYTRSMSDWCAWWAGEAKAALPNTPIYQSAGGWGFLEAGTDYSAQTAAMVPLGGGIRLTNETDSFEQDFYVTRLAATAARLMGAHLGYEPASSHTARGMAGRIFNTAMTNGDHFFTYQHNLMVHPMSIAQWLKYASVLDHRADPVVDVAVYYPETMNQLDDSTFRHLYASGFYPRARDVRRVVEVDYLDETLIRGGYLDRYKVLVFCWGNYIEADVLAAIDAWLRNGGTVVYPSFPRGALQTIEGDTQIFAKWSRSDTGAGSFKRFPGDMEPPSLYAEFLRDVLLATEALNPLTQTVVQSQLPEHVFVSIHQDGEAWVLNYRDNDTDVTLGNQTRNVPRYGIANWNIVSASE